MARFVYTPDIARISHNICRNETVRSFTLQSSKNACHADLGGHYGSSSLIKMVTYPWKWMETAEMEMQAGNMCWNLVAKEHQIVVWHKSTNRSAMDCGHATHIPLCPTFPGADAAW